MKTLLTFVSLISGTFAFAGGMASGSNQDLFLLLGILGGILILASYIPKFIRFIKHWLEPKKGVGALTDAPESTQE